MKQGSSTERRRMVAELTARWCGRWYDAEGRWIADRPPIETRKTLWLCFGLMAGDAEAVALGNAILARTEFEIHFQARNELEATSPFDIFVTNHSVQMLAMHRDRLDPAVRLKLEKWARVALGDYPGDRQADYQFHGYNDNMPAKATLGMILGGEYFGDGAAVEHGVWNLRLLRDLLTRRGLVSEYNSPTYSPNTLLNLTEISVLARHPEARVLAGQCVERVWADLLGHFHPPTGTLGGPFSRAYQLDSTGHFSSAACVLWIALGAEAAMNPVEEIDREPIRLVHHHDDRATQLGILAWIASCPLDPPPHLLAWMRGRTYPFRFLASAERGGLQGGEVNTTHHAEADFALGTAEGEAWSAHQSEVFFLNYRKKAAPPGMENLRTAYLRMMIDDERPGDREADHHLKSRSVVHTVQKGRVALVLANPVPELAGQPVRSLKLSLILPSHFGEADAVEQRGRHVIVRDGPLYIGLRPLNGTDWGRKEAVTVERVPNYLLISFYSYQGEPRTFTRPELARTLNGVVVVIGRADEESLDAFAARLEGDDLVDYFAFDCRGTTYRLGDDTLSFAYAVETSKVRYSTIDRKLTPRPLWKADGLPADRLPFLGGETPPEPLVFPFQHMNVIWAELPWVIASVPGGKA